MDRRSIIGTAIVFGVFLLACVCLYFFFQIPKPPPISPASVTPGDFALPAPGSMKRVQGAGPTPDELTGVFAAAKTPSGEAPPSDAAREVGDAMHVVLAGSLDAFRDYVRSRGGVVNVNLDDPAEVDAKWPAFKTWLRAYAGGPADLGAISVRWRFRHGKVVEVRNPSNAGEQFVESYQKFPALKDAMKFGKQGTETHADTIEFLVPTLHVYNGEETPVVLGIWVTWSAEAKRWIVSRGAVYEPKGVLRVIVVPPL